MTITTELLSDLMFSGYGHPGYCETCDEIDEHAGCEPDARGYTCPCCEEPTLNLV